MNTDYTYSSEDYIDDKNIMEEIYDDNKECTRFLVEKGDICFYIRIKEK